MTIAICTACGAQKFGAFVPCPRCRFEPKTVLEKAKSITLSDHSFALESLDQFRNMIESGIQIPFDPLSLAYSAGPIGEVEHFERNFDFEREILPCKRCGTRFAPETEEVLCPSCNAETQLSVCTGCTRVYDQHPKFCSECGAPLVVRENLTIEWLGREVAISVRRILKKADVVDQHQYLTGVRTLLSAEARSASEHELKNFGMYVAIWVMRPLVPSLQLLVSIVKEMVDLHRQSFLLMGASSEDSDQVSVLYMRRFDFYDKAIACNPEQWMLMLGNAGAKNCFGTEGHAGAAVEMALIAGYLMKVLQEVWRSMLTAYAH